jgi:uncharacterized protein (DUF697 family)/predicted GTPase
MAEADDQGRNVGQTDSENAPGPYDFEPEDFAKAFHDEQKALGRINIAIFGKSGVGKSSLVNVIFGEEMAKTGSGRPVTEDSCLYVNESEILGIYDNRGIEIGDGTDKIIGDFTRLMEANRHLGSKHHIHVIWFCIHGRGARLESAEVEFVKTAAALGVPVVVVLTQVRHKNGRSGEESVELASQISAEHLPIVSGRPVLVCAKPDISRGHEQFGLDGLLDITYLAAPEGVQAALTAAQIIDLKRKWTRCLAIATAAATAAGAAAVSPIPGSDAVVIVPIQLSMMAGIAVLYGTDPSMSTMAGIAAPAIASTFGKMAAGWVIKAIPGIGTAIGAIVNATVASGFTLAMGLAWGRVCERIASGELTRDDPAAVNTVFMAEFKSAFSRSMRDVEDQAPGSTDPSVE